MGSGLKLLGGTASFLAFGLGWGCAFSSTDYCVLQGQVLRRDGKPAAYCDLYLARSLSELERGSRPYGPEERADFHVPGENLYRFVKTDGQGRFQAVFRIRRHGAHPQVYYGHPLPRVFIQAETGPGKWARFSLDTEWGDWSSRLEGNLKPMDLGTLLLGEKPLRLSEPPPLKRAYMQVLEYPSLETGQARELRVRAEKAYRAGRFLEAARLYREAARLEPRNALPFYLTAESLFRAGKPRDALSFAGEAVRLDPWVGLGHFLRGLILERLGKKEEAVSALFMASQLDQALEEARARLEMLEPRARPFRESPLVTGER